MRPRAPLSYITAYLQFTIAVIFLIGYFALLYCIFVGKSAIPENLLELAKMLAIGLTNALGLMFAFLFLRSRVDGPPDPSTTTTRQTTETETLPSPPLPPSQPQVIHDQDQTAVTDPATAAPRGV